MYYINNKNTSIISVLARKYKQGRIVATRIKPLFNEKAEATETVFYVDT